MCVYVINEYIYVYVSIYLFMILYKHNFIN